ncbi:MAG: acyl-CoA dehydrogenase family protein, partial [Pseudomonadota bacterium]
MAVTIDRDVESLADQPLRQTISAAETLVGEAETLLGAATSFVGQSAERTPGGLNAIQTEAHGLAWLATYVEALRQLSAWAKRLDDESRAQRIDQLTLLAGIAEYAADISGGIAMSQGETVRLTDLGVPDDLQDRFLDAARPVVREGTSDAVRRELAELISAQREAMTFGDTGLDDVHAAMQEEMRRFSQADVLPHAHEWHLKNDYIPLETIAKLAELGVFGISMPEEFGGLGLGKEAMCIVSEELSRGYIGVGSLGTRSEIAGELILANGTPEQKERFLPGIASA